MFVQDNRSVNAARQSRVFAIFGAFSVLSLISLTGCGGGGGGSTPGLPVISASPSPTATATPVATPTPVATESAKDRAIAANFAPNYAPSTTDSSSKFLRWKSNKSLRVYIRPSVNSINDSTTNTNIDSAKARSIAEQATNNWTNSTSGDFTFTFVDNAANADIEVVFVNTIVSKTGTVNPNAVGLTNYEYTYPNAADTQHAYLTHAVVQVIASQSDSALLDTASHEFGHSLGIAQHSVDSGDLLYAISLPPATITDRDQNTLFYLYYSSNATGSRAVNTNAASTEVHSGEID